MKIVLNFNCPQPDRPRPRSRNDVFIHLPDLIDLNFSLYCICRGRRGECIIPIGTCAELCINKGCLFQDFSTRKHTSFLLMKVSGNPFLKSSKKGYVLKNSGCFCTQSKSPFCVEGISSFLMILLLCFSTVRLEMNSSSAI